MGKKTLLRNMETKRKGKHGIMWILGTFVYHFEPVIVQAVLHVLVIQSFRVAYHIISQESLAFYYLCHEKLDYAIESTVANTIKSINAIYTRQSMPYTRVNQCRIHASINAIYTRQSVSNRHQSMSYTRVNECHIHASMNAMYTSQSMPYTHVSINVIYTRQSMPYPQVNQCHKHTSINVIYTRQPRDKHTSMNAIYTRQ